MSHVRIAHGESLAIIGDYLFKKKSGHLLIVASKRSGLQTNILGYLQEVMPNLKIEYFSAFSPNPTFEDVWQGCHVLTRSKADAILTMGGGSAIDTAKSIAGLCALSEETARAAVKAGGKTLAKNNIPLIVLPTTAGSGSEATHFAVIYLAGKKYSLASPHLLPDLSLIDGDWTRSMPQELAAASAMDALCQAMESYWAVAATAESRKFAAASIKLLYANMAKAVVERDEQAQNRVAEAASLAGQAINISKTTAAHAYSYYLTMQHNIAHGHAVSLCFPAVVLNNYSADEIYLPEGELARRFADLFDMVEVKNIDEFMSWFRTLMNIMGLERDPQALGLDWTRERAAFLGSVNQQRLKNNPAAINIDHFTKIFMQDSHD